MFCSLVLLGSDTSYIYRFQEDIDSKTNRQTVPPSMKVTQDDQFSQAKLGSLWYRTKYTKARKMANFPQNP